MSVQLPKGWQTIKFGDVVEDSAFGPRFSGEKYAEDGNIASLRTTDMSEDGRISYENIPLAKLDESKFEKHFLEVGDLVITRSGRIGTTGIFEGADFPVIPGAFLIRFRLYKTVNPYFYKYFFNSSTGQRTILSVARGAAQQNITSTNVLNLKVPCPPLESQNKIADILSRYDETIANNRRRIELLERSSRLLYREWFVHLRYPGHEHGAIDPDGIPEGWEKKQVKQLLGEVKRPKKIKKEEYLKDGVLPCVDQSKSFIGGYTNDSDAAISLEHPVIIFGDHTRVLKFVDFPFASGADGTQLIISKEIEKISQEYFYFSLDAVDLSNYFYARHFKFLKDQWVSVPSRNLMRHFTVIVQSYMLQIKTLRFYNIQLAKARDLLLPRLMNGEINV